MNETDFWSRLEYRVTREMDGLEDCRRRGLWCDGFLPQHSLLGDIKRSIKGSVWIGFGSKEQKSWAFELFTPRSFRRIDELDWQELLPPDDVTAWLGVFFEQERLELWPARAQRGVDGPAMDP